MRLRCARCQTARVDTALASFFLCEECAIALAERAFNGTGPSSWDFGVAITSARWAFAARAIRSYTGRPSWGRTDERASAGWSWAAWRLGCWTWRRVRSSRCGGDRPPKQCGLPPRRRPGRPGHRREAKGGHRECSSTVPSAVSACDRSPENAEIGSPPTTSENVPPPMGPSGRRGTCWDWRTS